MTTKGKRAWLITWEGDDAENNGRCKIVAVLSPYFHRHNITLLLRVLFCSEYRLTLSEKMAFGLANKNQMPRFLIHAYRDINPAFYYGHFAHEYLYARQVKNLRCDESKKDVAENTLYWTELPKYVPVALDPSAPLPDDLSELTKMVVGEKPQSYTYTTADVTNPQQEPTS